MPQNADVVLQHTDGSSNTVDLTLWKDSPSLAGGYQLSSLPFLPPRQPTDDANYQQVDPKAAMTYDLTSFHRGFGQEKTGSSASLHDMVIQTAYLPCSTAR